MCPAPVVDGWAVWEVSFLDPESAVTPVVPAAGEVDGPLESFGSLAGGLELAVFWPVLSAIPLGFCI